ncbi:unnamed protein product [Fraxinus pennsylvanica]|uniref:CASP-like protein n=1 Tax=Fraxinus pennsylvanica TaxID=56036 RepID=A0AAD2DGW6_9LAMI|nr:unnamed protein product [Fraxinus pennsylvanica]
MENTGNKSLHKTQKISFASQILLRVLAIACTLAATWLVITSERGFRDRGQCTFIALANIIACAFSVLSLFIIFLLGYKAVDSRNYFIIFLYDLILTMLLMAGCAAATVIGYLGKYGEGHTGWTGIRDHFAKYCKRITLSVVLSFFSVVFYLLLTVTDSSAGPSSPYQEPQPPSVESDVTPLLTPPPPAPAPHMGSHPMSAQQQAAVRLHRSAHQLHHSS